MITHILLQQYWWCVASLVGALFVFLLFVQGGQSLIYSLVKTPEERNSLLAMLGHKWGLTYTTLVLFGGAMFAAFPLYYSTSFGGAYWLWISILFLFVIQAVSYEYRSKPANFLGQKTYDCFLFLNGFFGVLLLGVAVGMFFTGGAFTMGKMNITQIGQPVISSWTNDWHGLEAILNPFNLLLGAVLVFLTRTLALLYVMQQSDNEELRKRAKGMLLYYSLLFVVLFVGLLVYLYTLTGYAVDPANGSITPVAHKYVANLYQLPVLGILLLVGVLVVLAGIAATLVYKRDKVFWWVSAGAVLAVWSLLLSAGLNNTAYFSSTIEPQHSLTLYNSSSSEYTLTAMAVVSLLVPFVLLYIAYVWRALDKKKPVAPVEY
ncbi:MAG: cytochrome d ubiquinol oxidase subunit II [Prevotellaceae bacterium]|jgi:cytochrome d ubiquinol oxidase subunit II|nr:cytochrome d ubiquinol oxidase subunit II [Prevotellaceae bacterium]